MFLLCPCSNKGINNTATRYLWFVQTILFGFASLGLLLKYNPERRKHHWHQQRKPTEQHCTSWLKNPFPMPLLPPLSFSVVWSPAQRHGAEEDIWAYSLVVPEDVKVLKWRHIFDTDTTNICYLVDTITFVPVMVQHVFYSIDFL